MSRRVVVERAAFGPFDLVTCDDGTVWLKGQLPAGGFHQCRPDRALTADRLRDLVRAIDAAPNRRTLETLAQMIADKYPNDYWARELLEYTAHRERALGAESPDVLSPAA